MTIYKSGIYDSAVDYANAYGITDKTLYNWIKKFDKLTTPQALASQSNEIAQLKKDLHSIIPQ